MSQWLFFCCLILVGFVGDCDCQALEWCAAQDTEQHQQKSESERLHDLQRVEDYLKRLGLHDRVADWLEQNAARERDAVQRKVWQKRSADYYIEQILANQGHSDRWLARAERLLDEDAGAANPVLEAAVFQLRYTRHVREFELLWERGQIGTVWDAQPLVDLNTQLAQFRQRLRQQVDEIQQRPSIGESEIRQLERQLQQLETAIRRGDYLFGWTSYLLALARPADKYRWLEYADGGFRAFHQVDLDKPVQQLDKRWFDFSTGWTELGLVGWAMCCDAIGKPEDADFLFQLSDSSPRKLSATTQTAFQFKSKIYSQQWRDVLARFHQVLADKDMQSAEQAAICYSLFRMAQGISAPAVKSELTRRTLIGLTRNARYSAVRDLLGEFRLNLQQQGFSNLWILGSLQATEASDPSSLMSARSLLLAALEQVAESDSLRDIGRCHLLIGQLSYRIGDFDTALEHFDQAVVGLRRDRRLGPEALWLHAQTLTRLSSTDSPNVHLAMMGLEKLVHLFPESTWADRVPMEKLRLTAKSLPAQEAIRRYSEFDSRHRDYPLAMLEVVRLRYQLWRQRHDQTPESAEGVLNELRLAELAHRNLEVATSRNKLAGLLLVLDAELNQLPFQSDSFEPLRTVAVELGNKLPAGDELLAELVYCEFRKARLDEDIKNAVSKAVWLVEFARGRRFEQSALVFLVTLRGQGNIDATWNVPDSLRLLERLVEILGRDPERLRQNQNATIALYQLAVAYSNSEQWESAESAFQDLVDVFSNHIEYLVGLADAQMHRERLAEAKRIWDRISRGAAPGSDAWFAAQLGRVQCLVDSDLETARALFRQTATLSPEVPAQWQQKFAEVRDMLKPQSPR